LGKGRTVFAATKHDLVGEISIRKVPGDDPAPSVFLEPRLLRTKVQAEGSFWRIVDVKGALEARSYSTGLGSTLTIEVDDDERLAPWNIGTWTLAVDGNGVATKTGSGEAEVSVGVTELTSLWTALPPRRGHGDELSEWELLQARDSGALAKAQHRFAIPKQPFCMDDW
jgi:predicted acetyltransferase